MSVHIPDNLRPEAEQKLARAISVAKNYDGSEAGYNLFFEVSAAFEQCAKELLGDAIEGYAEREAALSEELIHEPITTQNLLERAIESFGARLKSNKSIIHTIDTDFCFLPTDGGDPFPESTGDGVYVAPRSEARTEALILALNSQGIYLDDIAIYSGVNRPNMVRSEPYKLIQIPRLNREVLICDVVGEAIFVGVGLRGPLFWATYTKEQLQQQEGITRIVARPDWINKTVDCLLSDNPIGPKTFVRSGKRAYPLTEDLILTKALEFAASHNWLLPRSRGDVDGLPGQNWNMWSQAIRNQSNSLTRPEIEGLHHLFQLYGLKIGKTENPKAIREAYERLQATGHHGLEPVGVFKLSEDLILTKVLEHAAANNGKLPTENSGEVEGLPGQTWMIWRTAIAKCYNGLTRPGLNGLLDLYQLYGLKIGKIENPEAIREAYVRLQATGHHGLEPVEVFKLSEDLILIKALEYAEAHDGLLPTQYAGDVEGLPGQVWKGWDSAVRRCSYGLTRQGMSGLPGLFHIYGLKIGKKENPKAIREAYERLKATGQHGLKPVEVVTLSEDLILTKALEYAESHDGLLPSSYSGDVDGYPGQTWQLWDSALRSSRNGLTRQGLTGLHHLLQFYGLKMGRAENPEAIKQALENIRKTGQHGLKPVEMFKLSEDLILTKALEYAAKHDGALPTIDSGEIDGYPGQVWRTWNTAIRGRSYGLTRRGVSGLNNLFQQYGLKIGSTDNADVIAQACERLEKTGQHGLKLTDEFTLSEDLILIKAIEFAAAHDWNLPTARQGRVKGLPGQNWGAWDQAIRNLSNGLTRKGLKGLGVLFQFYGLKMGIKENPKTIQQAYKNIQATGKHGLEPVEIFKLTEELILFKAIEYLMSHGKLPTHESGGVEGLPGQNWSAWHQSVKNRSNGLTRQGLTGLPGLFKFYGLKDGRQENPAAIQEIYELLKDRSSTADAIADSVSPTRNDPDSITADNKNSCG